MGNKSSQSRETASPSVIARTKTVKKPELLVKGVSARWVINFVRGSETMNKILEGDGKTEDILMEVKSHTAERKESMLDYLERHEPHTIKSKADAFISHAWKYKLRDMIESFELLSKEEDIFVWFDLLCVNQHEAPSYPPEFWTETFHASIHEIARTIVVISPWDDPANLRRAWCLWEIYGSTLSEKCKIEIFIVPSEKKLFRKDLDKSATLLARFGNIDIEKAQAFKESDRNMILNAARGAPGGTMAIRERIVSPLRSWMHHESEQLIAELEHEYKNNKNENTTMQLAQGYNKVGALLVDLGKPKEAQGLLSKSVELWEEINQGKPNWAYVEANSNLAAALKAQQYFEEAAQTLRVALESCEKLEGKTNDLSRIMHNLGTTLVDLRKNDEAIMLHKKALELDKSAEPVDLARVALGLRCLGSALLKSQATLDEAKKCFDDALAADLKVNQNPTCPDVALDFFNIAKWHFANKDFAESIKYYQQSLAIDLALFGDHNDRIIDTYAAMGAVYREDTNITEATKCFEEAYRISRRVFGGKSLKTAEAMLVLADIYCKDKRTNKKGYQNFMETFSIKRRVLGVEHEETQQVLGQFCKYLRAHGEEDEADILEGAFTKNVNVYASAQ